MVHGVGRRRWCARFATAGMIRMTWLALARGPLGTGADAYVALRVLRALCAHGRISALLVGVAKVVAANALGLAFLASEIPCMHMCSTDRACSQSTPPSTDAAHAV